VTLVVAHRGAPYAAPENTMAAFRAAAEMGADAIELDVHRSADGEVVVIHDPDLDRTTDRSGPVAQLTAAEIRLADAGAGERVPVLAEVLDWLPAQLGLVIEIKALAAVEPTLALLEGKAARRERRLSVISFEGDAIDAVRAGAPDIPTGLLREAGDPFDDGLALVVERGHTALHCFERDLGADPGLFVARAEEAGKQLGCWVIDDPDRMRQVTLARLTAFVTNRPDVARAVVDAARPARGRQAERS
jgi:glycerophosphoryl diester phosphodiesterase